MISLLQCQERIFVKLRKGKQTEKYPSYPTSLVCNSNNYPFSLFNDLSQPIMINGRISANSESLTPLIASLV